MGITFSRTGNTMGRALSLYADEAYLFIAESFQRPVSQHPLVRKEIGAGMGRVRGHS